MWRFGRSSCDGVGNRSFCARWSDAKRVSLTAFSLGYGYTGVSASRVAKSLSKLRFSNAKLQGCLSSVRTIPPPAATATTTDPKYQDLIKRDAGLKSFVAKTYLYTGGSLATAVGAGLVLLADPQLFSGHVLAMLGGGFVLSMGGVFGMGFTSYEVKTEVRKDAMTGEEGIYSYSENSLARKVSYASIIAGVSMIGAPSIAIASVQGVLTPALLYTGLIFTGATTYTLSRKAGELSTWGPALTGGLTALVGCGLASLGSAYFGGPKELTMLLHSVHLYAGIPLFTGLIAYDTHLAMEKYKEGDPDHLGTSVSLFLDLMNILTRMIQILGRNKD